MSAIDILVGEFNRLARRFDEWIDRRCARLDSDFVENEHPRDGDGKFTDAGGSSRRPLQETRVEGGVRVQANGSPLPEYIQKLKIPPAWTDVKYSDDPDASLLAVGKDAKGRQQSIYSAAFTATQAAAKFARISELSRKFDSIKAQNAEMQKSNSPRTRDNADCLALVMEMGIRPGSDTDTKAKVKAYGATTLEGRHVVRENGKVSLKFTGKKGVSINLPVENESLARMLTERAEKAGPDGKLFPSVTDKSLLDHTHSMDGGGFKTKDFRTLLGTTTAYAMVQKQAAPKSEKDYKKAVMDVAKAVSKKLGNTPTVALQSYIAPEVFGQWRIAV